MDPRKVLKFKKGTSTPKEEEEDTEMGAETQPAGIDVVSLQFLFLFLFLSMLAWIFPTANLCWDESKSRI